MAYETCRQSYFTDPPPGVRFAFGGIHGATLFFNDYTAAVDYFQRVQYIETK
jgi:hypothetical protein